MIAAFRLICWTLRTMKQKLWITIATYTAYCIDKELYKTIEYLKTQMEVLIEQQEKQNKRILLTNHQRIRVAAKVKRLSRKMLEHCTVLFTPDTVMRWYNKLIAEKYDGSHISCLRVTGGSIGIRYMAGCLLRNHCVRTTHLQIILTSLYQQMHNTSAYFGSTSEY